MFLFKVIGFIFIINAFFSSLRFFIDIGKWHKQEKRFKVIPSAEEVKNNERDNNDNYSGGYNFSDGSSDRTTNGSFEPGADGTSDSRSFFDIARDA